MGRKKTRASCGRGFLGKSRNRSGIVLSGGFLSCRIGAGSFVDAGGALVFLADFLDQAAGHEVLKFLVGAQAEHFLATADGIANLEIGENALEEIIETEHFLFGKDVAKLIGNMIRKAS